MPPTSQHRKAPERIETARLVLRRPTPEDAEAIFSTYAADPDVTPYVGFPRHQQIDDTRGFLTLSASLWVTWPAGPYLIHLRESDRLVGSTGLSFETPYRAQTGYVLAKSAWGHGFATEALRAMTMRRSTPLRHLPPRASSVGARARKGRLCPRRSASPLCRIPQPGAARTARLPLLRADFLISPLVQRGKRLHNMAQPSRPSTSVGAAGGQSATRIAREIFDQH